MDKQKSIESLQFFVAVGFALMMLLDVALNWECE